MFKDLVRQSKCSGVNVVTKPLDQVARMKTVLSPDGFVFHQSRVGSTLAANLLGSDPQNLVFSESAPPASTVYGNLDIVLDHFSRVSQLCPTPHALYAVFYLVPMLIGW